jgi:hypothetical protein
LTILPVRTSSPVQMTSICMLDPPAIAGYRGGNSSNVKKTFRLRGPTILNNVSARRAVRIASRASEGLKLIMDHNPLSVVCPASPQLPKQKPELREEATV